MSNLRSDARDFVKDREPGDVIRSYVERLCHQLDYVEELWHAAERRAQEAEKGRAELAAINRLCDEYDEFGEIYDPEGKLPPLAERVQGIVADLLSQLNGYKYGGP